MTLRRAAVAAGAVAGGAMAAGCSAGAGTIAAPTVHERQALQDLRGRLAGPTAVSPIFQDGNRPGVAIAVMKQQSNPVVPEVDVFRWVRSGWQSLARVTLDVGGSVADDATGATTPIATAHLTPSKVPDLVVTVHYNAGPASAVLSELGGHWHALTFHGGLAQDGDERFDVQVAPDGSLRSHENNCIPNCAQGHIVTTVYRFDPRTGQLAAQTNR
jgi:hypothetical protein